MVDLAKEGFIEKAEREIADAGARVAMWFKSAFQLTRDDGSVAHFTAGRNDVLETDADHWFVKAHEGGKPETIAPAPQAPLEPRDPNVADTGALRANEGGEAGQTEAPQANGSETQNELSKAAQDQLDAAMAQKAAQVKAPNA